MSRLDRTLPTMTWGENMQSLSVNIRYAGIEIRKHFYLSVGQVTLHVRLTCPTIFFHLSKNHASINAEPQVLQNKHNNKTISKLLHVAGYYYVLSQIHNSILGLLLALGFTKMEF